MKIRRTDHERRPADIARAVEIGALDPHAPKLSAVRPNKLNVVHYRKLAGGWTLCGLSAKTWPVARRSRTGLDDVCNDCRSRASKLRAFVRWAGIDWPVIPHIKRAASW